MKLQSLLIALMFALTTQVHAEGMYVGLSGGQADYDTAVTQLTGTAQLDDEDTAYKLFAGYRASNNFGVEFHYADLGEVSLSGNTGDTFIRGNGSALAFIVDGGKVAQEAKSYGVAATYALPLNDSFSLLGKIGFHRWDIENSSDEDGTEPFYGIGASYQVNDNIALQAEFERLQIDSIDVDDIDLLSVGLAFHF